MSVLTSPVKLVAATRGCGSLNDRSAEDVFGYAARVSNPQNQDKFDTAPKLLAYCLREKHYSIFETASMTLEITTSRAIADQLLRHRSATFQQHSQRYAASDSYIQYDARRQDVKNRQNSIADLSATDHPVMDTLYRAQKWQWNTKRAPRHSIGCSSCLCGPIPKYCVSLRMAVSSAYIEGFEAGQLTGPPDRPPRTGRCVRIFKRHKAASCYCKCLAFSTQMVTWEVQHGDNALTLQPQ